jgi:hypothetical protein
MNELSVEERGQPRREQAEAPGASGAGDRETLLQYVRGHRWGEAKETLNRLLAAAADEAEKQKLKRAEDKINALDFEEAEKLLAKE